MKQKTKPIYLLKNIYWVYDKNDPKTEVVPFIFNENRTLMMNFVSGKHYSLPAGHEPEELLERFVKKMAGKDVTVSSSDDLFFEIDVLECAGMADCDVDTTFVKPSLIKMIAYAAKKSIRSEIKVDRFVDRLEERDERKEEKKQARQEAKEAKKEAKQKAKDGQER